MSLRKLVSIGAITHPIINENNQNGGTFCWSEWAGNQGFSW